MNSHGDATDCCADKDGLVLREDNARAQSSNEHDPMSTKEPIICHWLPPSTTQFYSRGRTANPHKKLAELTAMAR